MRRALICVVLCAMVATTAPARGAGPTDRIWFAPGPGTLDYIQLFQAPQQWSHARQLFDVFKIYQQHTQTPPPPIVGPNSYAALSSAGVFRTLANWDKKLAIETGAVKEVYCTPDATGMRAAVADTLASIAAVESAGGKVSYLAMDEPFVAGRAKVCGGPALEPTADRVQTYVTGVHANATSVAIGLIEAYPFSDEASLERVLDLLQSRGVTPAFLHVDVDLAAMRAGNDFAQDMARLRGVCAGRHIPFGIILWGNNGDADALYALDAERLVNAVASAFPTWDQMPDHIIVQSWAESRTGLRITPTNLPESTPYTHTNLLWQFYRRLRGQTGGPLGTAVSRR